MTTVYPSVLKLLGYNDEKQLLGQHISDLMHPHDADKFSRYIENVHRAEASGAITGYHSEILAKKADSTCFPVEFTLSSLEYDGEELIGVALKDISERKEKTDILRVIFDNSSDAYFMLGHQGILDCNRAALQMLRCPNKKNLLDKPLSVFCAHPEMGCYSGNAFQEQVEKAFSEGFQRVDWEFSRMDGNLIMVEVAMTPVVISNQKVLLVVWHDISVRRLAEQAIKNNERKLRAVLDSTYQLLGMLLPDGTLIEANETALNLIGAIKDDVIGQKFWNTAWWQHSPEAQRQLKDGIDQARQGEVVRFITTHMGADRNIVHIDFTLTPVKDEQDNLMMIIAEGHDISALKKAEEAEKIARKAAEESNKAKGDFLANMSHEIRTPLNAIIGMTRLCLRTDLTERQQVLLEGVDGASKVLLGVLDDILDFSKIESGMLDIEKVAFDLNDVLSHVINLIALPAEEKKLELVINDNAVPNRLIGDPLRLQQVLANLATNAVKFTDQGEVVISVELMEQKSECTLFRFSVSDTGIGLDQDQLQKIFQSFTQADVSTTRKYGGTGLGLTISRRLVELMGGQLYVESELGKGSRFYFDLPLEIVGSFRVVDYDSQPGYRVLIVDDNEVCRQIECKLVESFGYSVQAVEGGETAVEWLVERREHFDVVLLDWDMPGIDGLMVAQILKTELGEQAPAIVLVTGVSNETVFNETNRAYVDGYAVKPVNRDILHHVILKCLRNLQDTEASSLSAAGQNSAENQNSPVRLLVVEDNDINQFVVKQTLEQSGYQVTLANNGQEAVDRVKEEAFQAVLMDLQMPVMDGFEATRRIREHFSKEELPIIAMTANVLRKHQLLCIEVGMNDYVVKPIDSDALSSVLGKWVPSGQLPGLEAVSDTLVPGNVAGIDLQYGVRQCAGDLPRFVAMLSKFVHDFKGAAREISTLAQAGQMEQLEYQAHRLRGVAANLGLTRIKHEAEQIELAVMGGQTHVNVDGLEQALEEAGRSLQSLIQKTKVDTDSGSRLDSEQLQALLIEVSEKLSQHEVLEPKTVESVYRELAGQVDQAEIESLRSCIENYQSREAIEILDEIMRKLIA